MEEYSQAYIDETGVIVIYAEGQEITVSVEEARKLTVRLCGLFSWGIKPKSTNAIGYLGEANANSTKKKPLGV